MITSSIHSMIAEYYGDDHWRIKGPPNDPILSFSHTFPPKSAHVVGWRPHNGSAPPVGNPGSATDDPTTSNYL